MERIFISNKGDDQKDGLSRENAIKSWKRLMEVSRGNAEWTYVEGNATRERLENEAGLNI
jgi:hypothetical protein